MLYDGGWITAVLVVPYAAIRLLATLNELVLSIRKKPLSSKYFFDGIFYMYVALSATAIFDAEHLLPSSFRTFVILSWIIGIVCDIIRGVILRYHEWRARQMETLFDLFSFLDRCHARAEKYSKRFMWCCIVAILLMLLAFWCDLHSKCVMVFEIAFLLSFLLSELLIRVDSCHGLFFHWFCGGIAFFAIQTVMLESVIGVELGERPIWDYVLFTVSFTVYWCFSIGVADDEAGKLAAQIVNTITTLLTVAINLIALYAGQRYSFIPWDTFQTYSLYCLLPVVASGYVAALFKDAQIYWRKKYPLNIKQEERYPEK